MYLDEAMKKALENGTLYRVPHDLDWEGEPHPLRGFLVELVDEYGSYSKAGFNCEARVLAPLQAVAKSYGWSQHQLIDLYEDFVDTDGLLVLEWDMATMLEQVDVNAVAHFAADTSAAGGGYADDGLLVWALNKRRAAEGKPPLFSDKDGDE